MHYRVPATRPSPLCPNCVENSAAHRVLLPLALSSILLYGVSIPSFGLLIFEATARPRWCAALLSSHGAALGVLPSRVAPSCMIFTVSFPLGLVCLGAWDVFFSSPSPPRSVAQCHLQQVCHHCIYAYRAPAELTAHVRNISASSISSGQTPRVARSFACQAQE